MTPLQAIKAAFEVRGVPTALYEIDEASKELKVDESFLRMLRDSTEVWQPLEDALIADGGKVIPEYQLGV
jgi:hypothetical protein